MVRTIGGRWSLGLIFHIYLSVTNTATMKSFVANLVVLSCALHESAAFSTSQLPQTSALAGHQTALNAATVGSSSSTRRGLDEVPPSPEPPRPPTVNESREMKTIRKELIEKYVSLGHSEDYAEREVNYFLEDSERSAQFVEMRRVAMRRGNDLGIEDFVQFAAAFVVGMSGGWLMNYFHTLQVRHQSCSTHHCETPVWACRHII